MRVNDHARLRGALVEMLNPLAWSEELLLTLHRELYLQPWTKGDVDLATGTVTVASEQPVSTDQVREAVEEAGYALAS